MPTPTVGIPYSYRRRIEAEHERLGLGSKTQTMAAILDVYFATLATPNVAASVKQIEPAVPELPAPPATPLPASQPTEEKREVFASYVNESSAD
jgi:hypothetical protein